MATKVRKMLSYILIALLLVSAGLILYIFTSYKGDYPDFSTYSTEGSGIKALYLLAGRLGFNTGRFHYPAIFLEDGYAMVVYRPDLDIFNDEIEKENLKEWILKGNTLILIPDEESLDFLWIFDTISELKDRHEVIDIGNITVTEYGLGKGSAYIMDRSWSFINSEIKNSDASVAFIRVLERIKPARVVFNEYYHDMQKSAPGILNLAGIPGQLAFIQMLLVVVLVIVRGWRPFGRPRYESKPDKRPENEVITALSGLYMRMRAYPLVLSNYYGYFVKKYDRFLNLSGTLQDEAKNTLNQCGEFIEQGSRKRNDLLKLVRKLERLDDEITATK